MFPSWMPGISGLINLTAGATEALGDAFLKNADQSQEVNDAWADIQMTASVMVENWIILSEEQALLTEGLEKDTEATEENTKAKKINIETSKGFKAETIANISALGKLAGALGQLNDASKGSALATARLQQASIIASTASGAMAAISPPTGAPNFAGWANFAAVILAGSAQAVSISQAMGDFNKAATGADFVTSGPQMLMVGDNPGGREQVSVTPLSSPNIDGPQGGSSNITLNISAPLVDDTVVDTIIPAINEAIRRGETLATS